MVQIVQSVQKAIAERNIDLQYIQFPLLLKFMGSGVKPVRGNFHVEPKLSLLSGGLEAIRFGEVPELIGYINWLIDDKNAGFVIGTTIQVDGGFLSGTGILI